MQVDNAPPPSIFSLRVIRTFVPGKDDGVQEVQELLQVVPPLHNVRAAVQVGEDVLLGRLEDPEIAINTATGWLVGSQQYSDIHPGFAAGVYDVVVDHRVEDRVDRFFPTLIDITQLDGSKVLTRVGCAVMTGEIVGEWVCTMTDDNFIVTANKTHFITQAPVRFTLIFYLISTV